MAELQLIPARHGTATFVPAGSTIKIVNTSGNQVIDTWAFALPNPPKKGDKKDPEDEKEDTDKKPADKKEEPKKDEKVEEKEKPKATPKKKGKNGMDLPSQEEAEQATREGLSKKDEAAEQANGTPQKSTWSSYVPSIGFRGGSAKKPEGETEQQKNSRTWSSWIPSGKGYSSYVPSGASTTLSAFAGSHHRDPNKSYLEQLQDFSKTPVGAAGYSGMAALTGSGYAGSAYAGYSAWNAANAPNQPPMEFMSMPHSRAATLHLVPKVGDTMVSNLREPMMTMVEDTGPGVHDTLMAACDPARYKGLGIDKWEEHGSCAENLVLALNELNERAGLKGAKGVGADVTINNVPAPLNLFMNIPWDDEGDLGFKAPKSKEGDYVRLKAERDVVVVMSACPQDILDINNKKPADGHFIVEEAEEEKEKPKKKPVPQRRASAQPKKLAPSSKGSEKADNDSTAGAEEKKPAVKKAVPQRRTSAAPAEKKAVPPRRASAVPKKPVKKEEGAENGTPAAPVEKKKPRKLAPRPKKEEPTEKE